MTDDAQGRPAADDDRLESEFL
ncbi:MAG: hypothetical protein JWP21_2866, partial [Tardiphaga sp.]|nr:hypothetical protein [Tardiphaga sp.]